MMTVQLGGNAQAVVAGNMATGGGNGGVVARGTTSKMANEPEGHGWRAHLELAHAAPRCGARRKRDRKPWQGSSMRNGRCRVHGG